MKNILVLGAGQSAPYLISYLLKEAENNDWFVTVCDRDYELAKSRVGKSKRGKAVEFDINDETMRKSLIQNTDIVVNFLAPVFQFLVAKECLESGKHCVTASYENVKVKELHAEAENKGIIILNEMGLDPGIDHISAMPVINRIIDNGGFVSSFISYGSGLPAPDVLSNPLRYCITWNPRNVVMAGEAGAHYLQDGKVKLMSQTQIFQRTWLVDVDGVGTLEAYPNRDSLIYTDILKLHKAKTIIRGTLRNVGWCETWSQIIKLGIPNEAMKLQNASEMTYAQFTEMFLPPSLPGKDLESKVAYYLGLNPTGKIMSNLKWLGLFSDEKVKGNPQTSAEVMTELIKYKLPLPAGARDMVIILHEIEAEYPAENKKEKITVTFVDYGEPNGFTAMSKTVGLPAAIAVKLILTGKLDIKGCQLPTNPAVYNPVLKELELMGLKIAEKVS